MRALAVSALVLALVPTVGFSADKEGRFAVKGAGITTCARYLEEWEKGSQVFYAYGGWLEGYLTATNQHLDDTYDIVPWENTNLLVGLLAQHCQQHKDKSFIRAVRAMLGAVRDDRLTESSVLIMAKSGDKGVRVYRDVVRRMQTQLGTLGHYTGNVDGLYGDGTREAVKAFQKKEGLEESGLPDQQTLMKLLR